MVVGCLGLDWGYLLFLGVIVGILVCLVLLLSFIVF